jgi:hypothetical protein
MGVTSILRSEGLISSDNFAATDVKKILNFCAISKGLLIVSPLKMISEMGFLEHFLLMASLRIDQVF